MKVFMWHGDREIERVTGVYYSIGWACEKLKALERAGWEFAGDSEPAPEDNNDVFASIIHGEGILLPEPDNPTDDKAVAVYLKFVSKDKLPRECMVKTGYLPRDSKLKERIKHPTQVNIDCHTVCDWTRGDACWARIVDIPGILSVDATAFR